MLADAELASLERAIVASVGPERVVELAGWLVPLDDGAIGRARSAVPLSQALDPGSIADVEALYRSAGLAPAFRLADTPAFAPVRGALARRGYVARTPTIMKLGAPDDLTRLSEETADLLTRPDEAWIDCFAGEGFDPAEAALRMRNLTRSPDALFVAVRDAGRTRAVGVVTFGQGWAGIHGMRTAPDSRRSGLASRVLATMGRAAEARGVTRVVLQVVEDNPARSLYRAGGLAAAWRYHYWGRA